ncbi:MAG: hypothetical protein WAN43_10755 [Rhodomicrobium sp.]
MADGYAHHRLRCGGALETGGSWLRDVLARHAGLRPCALLRGADADVKPRRLSLSALRRAEFEAPAERGGAGRRAAGAAGLSPRRRNKDGTAKAKAIAEIAKTGAEVPTLPGDILMFQGLPVSSQRAILDSAPEDEARRYALYVNRALWADPAFMRSHMCLFKKPLAEAAPAH